MSNIDTNIGSSSFFPKDRATTEAKRAQQLKRTALKRNELARKNELDGLASQDAKVNISDAIRDFSRIKKTVDATPDIDNSAKIAKLKAAINDGTYQVDYEGIADKILRDEILA